MLIYKNMLPSDTLEILSFKTKNIPLYEVKKNILHLDLQNGAPYMWYNAEEIACNSEQEEKEWVLLSIGTGHQWSQSIITKENYIGTLVLFGGGLVLHYFIVEKEIFERAF